MRQAIEATHHPIGVDGTSDVDGQTLPGVLVDHVQELQHPPVGGLVELEVEGPDDVGPDGQKAPTATPMPRRGFFLFL